MMTGTFAVTREEGGDWHRDRGAIVHSIWFEDGRQWDAIGGWRPALRPVTFADRVNLIVAEGNRKLDGILHKPARGMYQRQAAINAQMQAHAYYGGLGHYQAGSLFGGAF